MRFRASMAFRPMFRNGTWGRGRSYRDIKQDFPRVSVPLLPDPQRLRRGRSGRRDHRLSAPGLRSRPREL